MLDVGLSKLISLSMGGLPGPPPGLPPWPVLVGGLVGDPDMFLLLLLPKAKVSLSPPLRKTKQKNAKNAQKTPKKCQTSHTINHEPKYKLEYAQYESHLI